VKTSLKVDSMGRVVLPAKWRREQGIAPGSRVRIDADSNVLHLIPESASPSITRKGALLIHEGEATGDLLAAERRIRVDRDQRDRRNWGL
jgi:AbrB family looped-hinge helix DNA binding protein